MVKTCEIKTAADNLRENRKAPARALHTTLKTQLEEKGALAIYPCPHNPPCLIKNEDLARLIAFEVPELMHLLQAPQS